MQQLARMSQTTPASSKDIHAMLGDLDPLVVERLVATGATIEEIDEALREIEDEHGFGEMVHVPSSPRVAEVRAVLDELEVLDDDNVEDVEH